MTATSTTELEGILSAKKAELVAPIIEVHEYAPTLPHDVVTGEIVSASAADDVPPTSPVLPPSLGEPAAAPAPIEVRYPEIPPKVVGGLPYIRDYVKLARTIDQTEMVPVAFRGRYDAITAAFMRGYEMGLGPMQALASFNVIEGRVGLSAETMRALIMQAGHLFILSEEPGVAYVTCRRSDWPESIPSAVYRYDMDDAKIAGLLGPTRSGKPSAWDKNPRAMLAARATSGAGRAYFADVLAGMSYTPEEIRDFSGPEQEVPPSPAPALEASSAPAPPAAPPAPSTDGASATSPAGEPSSAPATPSDPPKRPRGRPRKDGTPPRAAQSAPPPEDTTPSAASDPSNPPEFTSLNTGEPGPGEGAVTVQMRQALTQILKGLPTIEQPRCRAFIQSHFIGRTSMDLNAEEIQKCIDIAAGWPDSIDQHPVPNENDPELFPFE